MLSDEVRLTLAVEAAFYEANVRELTEAYQKDRASGVPREDMLHAITGKLLGTELTRGQLASWPAWRSWPWSCSPNSPPPCNTDEVDNEQGEPMNTEHTCDIECGCGSWSTARRPASPSRRRGSVDLDVIEGNYDVNARNYEDRGDCE